MSPNADPCHGLRDQLAQNSRQQDEIREAFNDAHIPPAIRQRLQASLNKLSARAQGLHTELSRCMEQHKSPPVVTPPAVTPRSQQAFDNTVTAVALAGPPVRRAVASFVNQFTIFHADTGEFVGT
jgi:hypothetical protein